VVAEDGSDEDATLFPLVAMEDANGNHQRFVYHPLTGLPQYVIDGNGRGFSLHFGNVAGEQAPPKRVVSGWVVVGGGDCSYASQSRHSHGEPHRRSRRLHPSMLFAGNRAGFGDDGGNSGKLRNSTRYRGTGST